MEQMKKSIFQRAAEWGVPFGLYLTCAELAAIYADLFPPLNVISLALMLGSPVLAYYFQRRKFIEDDGFADFSSLWMLGILLFILGTVISSFIIFLVLRYLRPEFIYERTLAVIQAYREIPEMQNSEILRVLQRAVDEKMLPTPIEAVFNAFWFITFGGSVSSAITALIAGRQLNRKNNIKL